LNLYWSIKQARLDVLWQVGDWLPLLLPRDLRTIQTVHDLISVEHPEWFPQTGVSRWWSWNMRVKHAIRGATVVHAISTWTAGCILRSFPEVKDRVVMAYQGVRTPEKIQKTLSNGIHYPFVLILGTIEPRKNIPFACQSFLQFAQEYPEPHLVIAGKEGWKSGASIEAICALQQALPGRVHVRSYVTDEEKWTLLQEASALLMMSHAEGFGRPAIEAMSVGTPVIASANSALQEITEDAGVLVPPGDLQKTARALWRVLYHPLLTDRLIPLGLDRARCFLTSQMADQVMVRLKVDLINNKTTS